MIAQVLIILALFVVTLIQTELLLNQAITHYSQTEMGQMRQEIANVLRGDTTPDAQDSGTNLVITHADYQPTTHAMHGYFTLHSADNTFIDTLTARDVDYTVSQGTGGGTALYDGISDSMSKLEGRTGRNVVIALSDGGENQSHTSMSSVLQQAAAQNISIIS